MSIDVGGTFTDLCVLEGNTGKRTFHKSFTTYNDLTLGVLDAIRLGAEERRISVEAFLGETDRIVHGTTVATNALIEGKRSRVGALITKGFRDTLYFRTGEQKTNPYDYRIDYPDPFIPRFLTLPVRERINAEGGVEIPLNESDVRKALRQLRRLKVDAIAVLFLWSIANPAHEKRAGKVIQREWPEVPVFLSHQVNPVIREYQRFISTAIDASLYKLVKDYTIKLETRLRKNKFSGQLFMMTSTAGVVRAKEMAKHPILIVDSGPSMLPVAGLKIAELEVNYKTYVCVDMGGTSFDVAYVRDGQIITTWDSKINSDYLGISKVDVESIGAGGGSVAWVDQGALLHVGPQSTGSEPGPACYGRGGKLPTVTDSDLVLGYLSTVSFFGGRWTLSTELAREAIRKNIANRLGVDIMHAAYLMNKVVNTNMLSAIRELGIRRGVDPSKQILISGGAAAGLHTLLIAKELKMKHVIIPRSAGVLSAYGGIDANIQREFTRSFYSETNNMDYKGLNSVLEDLEESGLRFLDQSEIPKKRQELVFSVEARYPFQVHELEVQLSAKRLAPKVVEKLIDDFHAAHERIYTTRAPTPYLECVHWKVKAIGRTVNPPEPRWPRHSGAKVALKGERDAWFSEGKPTRTKVYEGSKLGAGTEIEGPAIIEELTTTILIPPAQRTLVTKSGNYLVEID